MSSFYKVVKNIYDNRDSLQPDRHLIKVLTDIQKTLRPGNDLAKLTEMKLLKQPVSCHRIDGVHSVSVLKSANKNIMLLGVENEQSSIYDYLREMLSKQIDTHVDLFIHYPYSKYKQITDHVSQSYRSKNQFMLDSEDMIKNFPHVRFHYCDLRTEWHDGESEDQLLDRVHLLSAYSQYVVDGDEDEFIKEMLQIKMPEIDILALDQRLNNLEGKVMKSFYNSDHKDLSDKMILWFNSTTKDCRTRLLSIKKAILSEPRFIASYYLSYLKELNHLYNHVNTLYTMLRMFRTFKTVKYQHSDSPKDCIIVLPKEMIHWISEFLTDNVLFTFVYQNEQSPSEINQCLLDQLIKEWRK